MPFRFFLKGRKMTAKQISKYQEGDTVDLFALIAEATVRQTRKGDNYLSLTFQDQSAKISGNLWDVTEAQQKAFVTGQVVHVIGTISSYQGQAQVNINDLQLPQDGEPNDPTMFVPSAPESEEELKNDLRPFLVAIKEPVWRAIVFYLIQQHGEAFFKAPAAKMNHHAFVGGLAYHTLSILRLAQAVCDLYPDINKSLLYAGATIHDLGKTIELSGPIATEYTDAGKLLGHISLIDGEICEACQKLKIDAEHGPAVLLRHMVLSHHGLMEYGSPVRPQLREAEILHHLDELDADIMMMNTALSQTEPGHFTDKIFALDKRSFYRPADGDNEENHKK